MEPKPSGVLRKVLIVRNAYHWQYGGAEQFAYNLAHELRGEGVDSVVVSRVPELLRHCRRDGVRTFRNLWLRNEAHRRWAPVYYALFPLLIGQYLWLIARHRPQLLILTSRDDQIFGTMAAKLAGVPVVWFDHADMKHIVASPFRFLRTSYYWALRAADRVIMTSQAEWDKITQGYPRAQQRNFVKILNGALRGSGAAMARPQGKKIVAYAGRLDRDKGLLDLAEAAALVAKQVPEVEFWLGGKGPDEGLLREKLEALGVADHVKLLGHLDNVWSLLLAADLFVYPTHHDAAPLAPAEAVLAGVPVVATQIGGIPEMIPPTAGVLVPAHNPAALAEAISGLLSDEGRLATLREGAKAAAHDLEFATVTREKYVPLFEQLVRARR
jgi:glycosyltransferase involved in cell wall biosynthesis